MYEVLLVVYLVVAIILIGFILVQQGKGASMGASFGNGASGTIFGSRGAGNFLSHTTAVLATAFFLISIILGSLNVHQGQSNKEQGFSDLSQVAEQVQEKQQNKEDHSDIPQ